MIVDIENALKHEVEFYYEEVGPGVIECHVHALGKIFTEHVPAMLGSDEPEFWSTKDGQPLGTDLTDKEN